MTREPAILLASSASLKAQCRKFLKLYTEQKKYVELHIENTPRYDLEGNKAGFVTKEDVESLAKKLQEIKKLH